MGALLDGVVECASREEALELADRYPSVFAIVGVHPNHAVEEAELMADCEITSVYAGIAGGHIDGFNSHGIVAVKNREVTENDVRRVIDAAALRPYRARSRRRLSGVLLPLGSLVQ